MKENGTRLAMLFQGDCRDVVRKLPEGAAHCVVTSPPYWGLRDYGLPPSVWGQNGDCDHEWKDASWVNSNASGGWQGGAQTGLEGGLPEGERVADYKQRRIPGAFCPCGAWLGTLGLEPTPELYVEHLVEIFREVWKTLRGDGTVWLNLGDSYNAAGRSGHGTRVGFKQNTNRASAAGLDTCRPSANGLKQKDLVGIPWRVAFALQADGWYLRSDIIWAKPNPMPESVKDRPTKSHEYLFLLSKSKKYYYDLEAIKEPFQTDSKENYPARARITGRGNQAAARERGNDRGKSGGFPANGGRNRRSVWTISTKPYKEAHFATFPPDLVEPCILAGCPEGGTVLDPFSGSGTVGMVALQHNRDFIGIDLSTDYTLLAEKRILENTGVSPILV